MAHFEHHWVTRTRLSVTLYVHCLVSYKVNVELVFSEVDNPQCDCVEAVGVYVTSL
jgi:hypothetical protein